MAHIFRVSELTEAIKNVVESQFPFVWVKGQVSNLARPASGHVYFNLKDESALLNVVWFKGNQWQGGEGCVNPLTGEVCEGPALGLEHGMEVLCAGRLTVYPPRGDYQLVAELVQQEGVGRLHLEFEELKRKLLARGWFDVERKMVLPPNPRRIALVTATTGAAVRDFLRIAAERGAGCEVRLHPVLVQGERAPEQIAAAVAEADEQSWAQAVVLVRGGGSLEDLWAFNTEAVAQAIFDCRLPVLCGVGHEVDTTIADLVADVRAATPSHAAQLLWTERRELVQRVDDLELRLAETWNGVVRSRERQLMAMEKGLAWLSPLARLKRLEKVLSAAGLRLERVTSGRMATAEHAVRELLARMLRAHDLRALRVPESELQGLACRLDDAFGRMVVEAGHTLETAQLRLNAVDPERPLQRGYAMVRVRESGVYLRSPRDVLPGDHLDIRVRDGHVAAMVNEENEDEA